MGESEAKLVGFCALKRVSPVLFDLEAMFIEPDYIGSGYGRKLMTHAKIMAIEKGAE